MAASSSDERVMTWLKTFRQQIGASQIQVAVRAGVSRESVRTIERGELETMYIGTLVRVAHSLGASVADLTPAIGERPSQGSGRRRLR